MASHLLPQHLLCCPACHADLSVQTGSYRCIAAECGLTFPSVDGVPILVDEKSSIFDTAGFLDRKPTFFKPVGRVREWVSSQIPSLTNNVSARKNFAQLREMLCERDSQSTVLVIGGGVLGAGMEPLIDEPRITVIETDAALGPRTQLICDAHDLPLKDASVDAVIVQAVLEHVVQPTRCVDEIYRVLRPNGFVYADTPFIQQVHGREFDFTRFTRLGHRRLFRRFAEVASGITCGPGTALAWTLRYFLMSFFNSKHLRAAASVFSRFAFFWLKYFDHILVNKVAALDAASAFYFLGRKSDQVLSDRELVAAYRGGF